MKRNSFLIKLPAAVFFVLAMVVLAKAQVIPTPPQASGFTLKVLLEGIYNPDSHKLNKVQGHDGDEAYNQFGSTIAEYITIELHAPGSYGINPIIYSNVKLYQDGSASTNLPVTGTYWLTIKSRNHLETVSAVPINLATTDSYDFTTAANQAYGSNQKLLEIGVYGIYAGDVNGDGVINVIDRDIISTDFFSSKTGFEKNDLNGDAYVTVADREYANVSFFASIQKNTPQ